MPTSVRQTSDYCDRCQRNRLFTATAQEPNHILHLLVTIFCCFLWGIVWLFISITSPAAAYRCVSCGMPQDNGDYSNASLPARHKSRKSNSGIPKIPYFDVPNAATNSPVAQPKPRREWLTKKQVHNIGFALVLTLPTLIMAVIIWRVSR